MIAAYREPDRTRGRELMSKLIESISHGPPKALVAFITLGRTLKKRAADVLAYFNRPGTSNWPTEAINGRLERLRGSALRFRTPTIASPDHCLRPAASGPDYTLDWDQPVNRTCPGVTHVIPRGGERV